jgi:hypothetical protein
MYVHLLVVMPIRAVQRTDQGIDRLCYALCCLHPQQAKELAAGEKALKSGQAALDKKTAALEKREAEVETARKEVRCSVAGVRWCVSVGGRAVRQ